MKNKKDASRNSAVFWQMAKDYVDHRLPEVRKSSPNTVKAYRNSLNKYIDYLESEKKIRRTDISFLDFNKANIADFLDWMLNVKKYAYKTCNLRITVIHALLEYAANENSTDLMAVYLEACTVKGLKATANPIEYFEGYQMKVLLAAPDGKTTTGRRSQMMLILYYDTAARISELLEMTVGHLKSYLRAFHRDTSADCPLFYARSHGRIHALFHDTVESMIKRYSKMCVGNGTSMPEQQLLGHESMSTASGFYAFATIETLSKSMAAANQEGTGAGKKWDDWGILEKIYSL